MLVYIKFHLILFEQNFLEKAKKSARSSEEQQAIKEYEKITRDREKIMKDAR